jgi:hypothetical protein
VIEKTKGDEGEKMGVLHAWEKRERREEERRACVRNMGEGEKEKKRKKKKREVSGREKRKKEVEKEGKWVVGREVVRSNKEENRESDKVGHMACTEWLGEDRVIFS